MSLPTDARARKNVPLFRGLLRYFPDALCAVAELSRIGNEQHNPGEEMHWAKEKSTDEADALVRHLIDSGTIDPSDGVRHTTKVAWRALALLQREIDGSRPETPQAAWDRESREHVAGIQLRPVEGRPARCQHGVYGCDKGAYLHVHLDAITTGGEWVPLKGRG
jgi:hypothetical protein